MCFQVPIAYRAEEKTFAYLFSKPDLRRHRQQLERLNFVGEVSLLKAWLIKACSRTLQ